MRKIGTARAIAGIVNHVRKNGLRRPTMSHARSILAAEGSSNTIKATLRAVVPGSGDDVPRSLRRAVYGADRHRCRACGSRHDLTIDHIVPRHLGGPSIRANLQTLCRRCNSSKRDRLDWKGRKL